MGRGRLVALLLRPPYSLLAAVSPITPLRAPAVLPTNPSTLVFFHCMACVTVTCSFVQLPLRRTSSHSTSLFPFPFPSIFRLGKRSANFQLSLVRCQDASLCSRCLADAQRRTSRTSVRTGVCCVVAMAASIPAPSVAPPAMHDPSSNPTAPLPPSQCLRNPPIMASCHLGSL